MIQVCFVCLGNICRSPIAEGVMRHLVRAEKLEDAITVDSAGTAGYHSGEPPDSRASAAGKRRGIAVAGRARKFERADFERFAYVVAMDRQNYDDLRDLASDSTLPRLVLLRSFDPDSPAGASVPDPFYGSDSGFDEVVELCQKACRGLLAKIRRDHGLE